MLVVTHHAIKDPQTAFERGETLVRNEGAPSGARGLQFLPAEDGSQVLCLWAADSVSAMQDYVDSVLGDASENSCSALDTEAAFATLPAELAPSPHATTA